MIFTLRDSINSDVDAIIITQTTDRDELQDIIDEVKANNDDWQFADIENALPEDCEVYAAWADEFNSVWY